MRRRLHERITLQAKVGGGEEELAIRLDFQQGADGREFLQLWIVFQYLFGVVMAAGSKFHVADDRRPITGRGSEREWSNGIERLEDVALSGNQCAAEGVIEIMFLHDFPGKEIDRLAIAAFYIQALRESVFNFVGVGERGIAVKADEVREIVHAGNVTPGERGLDGVLVAPAGLRTVKIAFQGGRAQLDGKFPGVAIDGSSGKSASVVERISGVGRAEASGGGDAKPVPEVQRNGDLGCEFGARHERGSADELIVAMHRAEEGIEGKVDGQLAPRGLFHGVEPNFGSAAQGDAVRRAEREITPVIQSGDVEAESAEIVGEKNGAADFGIDGIAISI